MSQEQQSVTEHLLHRTLEDLSEFEVTPLNVARVVFSTVCAAGILVRYYIHMLTMMAVYDDLEPRENYTEMLESPVGAKPSNERSARALTMAVAGATLFDPFGVEPAYLSLWLFANWLVIALDMPAYLFRRVIRDG